MSPHKSFPLFSALPAEIQLQVWDAATAPLELPAMHVLDVVAPYPASSSTSLQQPQGAATKAYPIRQRPRLPRRSSSNSTITTTNGSKTSPGRQGGGNRIRKRTPSPPAAATNRRNATYLDTLTTDNTTTAAILEEVTLSALDTATVPSSSSSSSSSSGTARFLFDPSMYTLRENLLSTCVDAASSVSKLHSQTMTTTTTTTTTTVSSEGFPQQVRNSDDDNNNNRTATVELSSGRRFTYNNAQDVLHLRFVLSQPSTTASRPGSTPSSPLPPPTTTTYSQPVPGRILHKGITSSSSSLSTHPLSAIFQALWSPPLARALHTARRIAIDVSQIWPTLGTTDSDAATSSFSSPSSEADHYHQQQQQQYHHSRLVQDIVFLACTIQDDLEVLYLVDYSATRMTRMKRRRCSRHCDDTTTAPSQDTPKTAPGVIVPEEAAAAAAQHPQDPRTSALYRALNPSTKDPQENHNDSAGDDETTQMQEAWDSKLDQQERNRQPDVIHGVGRVWRETFDLEALGWHDKHPGFVFGETLGEVIRLQQGNWHGQGNKRPAFKGVRVLVAEEEDEVDVIDTTVLGCERRRT